MYYNKAFFFNFAHFPNVPKNPISKANPMLKHLEIVQFCPRAVINKSFYIYSNFFIKKNTNYCKFIATSVSNFFFRI